MNKNLFDGTKKKLTKKQLMTTAIARATDELCRTAVSPYGKRFLQEMRVFVKDIKPTKKKLVKKKRSPRGKRVMRALETGLADLEAGKPFKTWQVQLNTDGTTTRTKGITVLDKTTGKWVFKAYKGKK